MGRGNPRSRAVLGALLAISLALVVLDSREGVNPVTGGARTAGAAVFAPVSAGVSTLANPVRDTYRTLAAAPEAEERIRELEAENRELAGKLRARERDDGRGERLDDLLHLSGLGQYTIVPAQAVTQVTARGYSDTVTLDVGRRDGVRPDMTVINGEGLVGRVTTATADTATVLLVTDASSAVGARMTDSREIGVVRGAGRAVHDSARLRFELMDPNQRLRDGQKIVTLGSHGGAPFVPGVPVGTVTAPKKTPGALSSTAEVTPAVDLSTLDIVGVVVAGPDEESREPTRPPEPKKEER